MRDHKPRIQKRQEFKQVIGLLVLVLAVAAVSFALGVSVGRRAAAPVAGMTAGGVRMAVGDTHKPVNPEEPPGEEAPKVNLTFYDTLPRGEETPLGSGINSPPSPGGEERAPEAAGAAQQPPGGESGSGEKPEVRSGETHKPKPPAVTSGEYVVQVASFQKDVDARTLQGKLLAKGHRAFLQRVDLGAKGVWTRVYIGFFNSAETAKRVADRLIDEERLSPIVRRRD